MNYYELKYDKDHYSPKEMNKFTTKVIGLKVVKELLERAFGPTDREDYHFGGVKGKRKKSDDNCRSSTTCMSWNNTHS
eukprot:2569538-Ditylum_brightwellii.AAC.1